MYQTFARLKFALRQLLFDELKYGCGESLQTYLTAFSLGFIGVTQLKNNGTGLTGYQE